MAVKIKVNSRRIILVGCRSIIRKSRCGEAILSISRRRVTGTIARIESLDRRNSRESLFLSFSPDPSIRERRRANSRAWGGWLLRSPDRSRKVASSGKEERRGNDDLESETENAKSDARGPHPGVVYSRTVNRCTRERLAYARANEFKAARREKSRGRRCIGESREERD